MSHPIEYQQNLYITFLWSERYRPFLVICKWGFITD